MTVSDKNRNEYVYSTINKEEIVTDKISSTQRTLIVPTIGIRHLQLFLQFLLAFIAFASRVSISVAIVAMTDPSASSNPTIPTYPDWKERNLILSSFFWGYLLTQAFAGWAANRYGPKWFLIGTFTIQSILGGLTPFAAAYLGPKGVVGIRVIQGLCQGFIYPSLAHALSQWAPAEERSRLGTIVYAAGSCGTVFGLFITGYISASSYGWPMVFYLFGTLGMAWCICMYLFGYNGPADHPTISEVEKIYIEESLGHTDEHKKRSTPWKEIFTSWQVWALFITQTGNNYCFWTLLNQIPAYMNYVMQFDIKSNSLLSSLPYLALWVLSFVVGFLSDAIINNGILSRTTSRKVFNTIGLFVPACALIILGYTRSDQTTQAVILLIVAVGANAAAYCGWSVNHIDLTPNHAGTLMGVLNGASQIASISSPMVVQLLVTNESDPLQWRMVFFITAGICIVAASCFAILGSAEVQPWNDKSEEQKV